VITTTIRKLSPRAEFCLVLAVCCWWAIYSSVLSIAHRSWTNGSQAQEHFIGIGIVLGEQGHNVIIQEILPHTPASEAGLSSGLVIQKIDGISLVGKPLKDCGDLVRGLTGSKVTLELVDPANNKTNTVELTRELIPTPPPRARITDHSTLLVTLFELLGLVITFGIARARGWPLAAWGFKPSWKDIGAGVLLCLVTAGIMIAIIATANAIYSGMIHGHLAGHLSLPILVFFLVINPIFEETIETGYFVQSLQRYGMLTAILASALFRAFLHAYQGISAAVVIFPLGLIFGFVYWKWRRLWPLFVAHALFDVYAYFRFHDP